MAMDSFDERLMSRCLRCGEMVSKTDLGMDGVCRACKTRHKKTMWQIQEEKRLVKDEQRSLNAVRVSCPICGREHLITEDRKKCECGYMLRK